MDADADVAGSIERGEQGLGFRTEQASHPLRERRGKILLRRGDTPCPDVVSAVQSGASFSGTSWPSCRISSMKRSTESKSR